MVVYSLDASYFSTINCVGTPMLEVSVTCDTPEECREDIAHQAPPGCLAWTTTGVRRVTSEED